MKRIFLICLLILMTGLASQAQKIEFKKISAKKFQSLIQKDNNHVLIDVSRKIDHIEGYIAGALFAESSEKLYSILDTTPSSRSILVYCRYGKRSQKACWLIAEKYPHKIYSLAKGFEDWKAKGYKLVN
ncbi:rhodanese-like domain-containing protein [Ancylomarina salipaludis]|uniref:Rhodanese-like domain-containing protein n=1 Tax=Ancylomarina salipaludis TaxID=2501299 RepID=A0A4Q1JN41_9BACT|nr:rhodanese-like domain-containing protein [Ancylomarina salipaludis]RXQ95118.1 rhodanese-like domain-containing protein [Ancylomarina salipaludis]